PTSEGMFDVLYEFIVREFGAKPGVSKYKTPDTPRSKLLAIEEHTLRVHYFPDQRWTTLYVENAGASMEGFAWVEKIGKRFNEVLAQRKHQELFTEFK